MSTATTRGTDVPARPRPRLIATDLDGTLLHDDGTVTPRTARALAGLARAGIELVLVTARPPRWVHHLDCLPEHGVVICANGALVYDVARSAVLEYRALSGDVVRAVVADVRRVLPDSAFAAERPSGFATEHGYRGHHPVPDDVVRAERIEDVLDDATVKLLVRSPATPDEQVHARVAEVLDGRAIVLDSGASGLAEVQHPAVSKAAALERWAAEHGIAAGEVWAFGDMPNDLPMLAWAGRGFAVANAHPAVRAAADEVCGTNCDDGVAAVLETLLVG